MKTGIVFEGGAFRTVFSCGVMDSFLDENIMSDYIIGVSAGAAYGTSYAAKQRGRDLSIIMKYSHDKRYMGFRNLINPKNRSYYGLDFAYNSVPNELVPFDYEEYSRFKGEFKVVVTNVLTGNPEYLPLDVNDNKFKLLQATCALPLLFPFIYINDIPYLDGGLSDSIPYEKAFEDGCDKVVVVLTRQPGYKKITSRSTKRITYLYRKYPELVKDLLLRAKRYNASLDRLLELENEGKVIVIRPTITDGFGRLEKDFEKIQALYDDGIKKGIDISNEVKNFFNQ
ncbi:Predicted phospholipase, patatin/cPLA2 family [[Clostridium] fimetarium]|uniref:Predicted phospholipase, patatin/cPLA2 family n=2 Tax=[Clostridium] fimetarium TaxID=99656 RepID=A0A1I0R404_9FIRM|nr:Predicted phospholipase, patatin/cPLA2 family [[Clostridium] fimetarium]